MQTYSEKLTSRYPHLAAAFATIPQGETHLHRLQDLNNTWRNMLLSGSTRHYTEVVVTEDRPTLPAEDSFDIIYAGGGLNLLNAAIMSHRFGLRVLVFDRFTVGAVHREWNISRDELQELLEVGLLTPDELESVIQREYCDGLIRFHSQHIQIPAAELHLRGVLDVAVDAEKLTSLCIRKIQEQQLSGLPNVILHNTTFVRCAVQSSSGVTVDVINTSGQKQSFSARLLIDGMGSTSPIACQLNCGRPFSLVCPTVGTVARGYKRGNTPGAIDPEVGEVLMTTGDARNGRQLIWEAFPGAGDQVAIYLFHYAEAGTSVDLLELFDRFFDQLPSYKDTSAVEIIKPVYGFIPAGYNISLPWQKKPRALAYDRVLSLGDAAAFQSPLTFCGFGSYVRNVRRITTLLALALETNCLRASDLNLIRASEAVPAVARAFSKFMIAKPEQAEAPWQVNETLNVFCRVLYDMGPRITSAFFKDRISWRDYTRLVLKTPAYYPKIYRLAFSTLSLAEAIGWITAWLQLGRQSAGYLLYRTAKPLLHSSPGSLAAASVSRAFPSLGLHIAVTGEAMKQVARGADEQATRTGKRRGIAYWLGGLWPQG